MHTEKLIRKFTSPTINAGRPLDDPMPEGSLEEVRRLLAVSSPSLTNAAIEEPELRGHVQLYTLRPAVGTKG